MVKPNFEKADGLGIGMISKKTPSLYIQIPNIWLGYGFELEI